MDKASPLMFGYVYQLLMLRASRLAATGRHGLRSLASRSQVSTKALDDVMDSTLGISGAKSPLTAELEESSMQEEVIMQSEGLEMDGKGPPPANNNYAKNMSKKPSPADYISFNIHHLHVKSSRNNTIVNLTDPKGKTIFRTSGAQMGFKGANRASYECGYACATAALKRTSELLGSGPFHLHIFLNGFGQGREAIYRALIASDHEEVKNSVVALSDSTPLKIGGTRPKKTRRL
jgi:small subunit ribosomal protein S11